jgi:hypothetical protein
MAPEISFPTKIHFNLNIQRELVPNLTFTIAYVGSQGSHETRKSSRNGADPTFCPCPDQPDTPDFDESTLAAGTKFFPAGSPRRNPNFEEMPTESTDVNSTYHAFQLSLNQRFSRGLQFQVAYSYSKAIDDASQHLGSQGRNAASRHEQWDDRKSARGLSNWDVRNNFTFNTTYELPFGSGLSGAARQLVNGWTVNGILTFTDGPPFMIQSGVRGVRDANRNRRSRPDLAPGRSNNPVLGGPDQYFDPTAFVPQPLGTFGNLARNTVTAPGLANLDLAVNKNFPIREELAIQFRAEFFNITNHPNFFLPDVQIFSGNPANPSRRGAAGRISQTNTTSRQIQFGIKVLF